MIVDPKSDRGSVAAGAGVRQVDTDRPSGHNPGMGARDINVLHVIGDDTPDSRLEALRALHTRPELGCQRIVRFGAARTDRTGFEGAERFEAPFGIGWLDRRPLSRWLAPTGRSVVHVWSPTALSWVLPWAKSDRRLGTTGRGGDYRLLVDLEFPLDVRRLARGISPLRQETGLRFVCPSDTLRRRLAEVGISPDDCALIRDSVDFSVVNAVRQSAVRGELRLREDDLLILILPPLRRETGALTAAWGAIILEQVRSGVRLIMPEGGREAGRISWLIESGGQGGMLGTPRRRYTVCELLAAADLAVYVPPADAPLGSVALAMAAGTPILASAVPATTELLAHGQNAWLCRADNPQDVARRLLQAVENPPQSQRQARLARSQAYQAFSRRRMIDQYLRAYENLFSNRRFAEGLEELVVLR